MTRGSPARDRRGAPSPQDATGVRVAAGLGEGLGVGDGHIFFTVNVTAVPSFTGVFGAGFWLTTSPLHSPVPS